MTRPEMGTLLRFPVSHATAFPHTTLPFPVHVPATPTHPALCRDAHHHGNHPTHQPNKSILLSP